MALQRHSVTAWSWGWRRRIARRPSTVALLGLVLFAIGCSATSTGPRTRTSPAASSRGSDVINGVCPITGRPVARHAPTITYKGRTIGFCSEPCVTEWKTLAEPMQANFVEMTAAAGVSRRR